MKWYEISISVMAMVALFIHSMDHFANNLKKRIGDRTNRLFSIVSNSRPKGFLFGFVATGIVQSSSVVISILISFVDSGMISFTGSLPILLGSNLGTTITAWLITLDINFLGTALIVIGFIVGYFPERIRLFSKPLFYLGLILFSLQLLDQTLAPLKESEKMIHFLSYAAHPISGIFLGILATAITQSSSVTVGLAIILAGQQVIQLESAIGIIVGSNIGTTSTAFLAAIKLNRLAKKTALINLYFNLFGAVLYLPFHNLFTELVRNVSGDLSVQVALAHLFFNLGIAAILLPFTTVIGNYFGKGTALKP